MKRGIIGRASTRAKTVTAHAKPANELDKKQGDVSHDYGNESLGFRHTSIGHPCSAEGSRIH